MAVDDSYTKSLLHFDGNLTDESGKLWTAYGGAATSTTQSKFGGSSLYLDGVNDYVSTPESAEWQFSTRVFTVDFQIYVISAPTSNYRGIIEKWYGDLGWLVQFKTSGSTAITGRFGSVDISSSSLSVGWHHCALVGDGTTGYFFVDGISIGTTNISGLDMVNSGHNLFISGDGSSTLYNVAAPFYLDELRSSNGIARWTSNFTPPAAPYGANPLFAQVF